MDQKRRLADLIHQAITMWDHGDPSEFIADYLTKNTTVVHGWFSVNDLPKKTGKYLVCTSNGNVWIDKFYVPVPNGMSQQKPYWSNKKIRNSITHWCFLPEIPNVYRISEEAKNAMLKMGQNAHPKQENTAVSHSVFEDCPCFECAYEKIDVPHCEECNRSNGFSYFRKKAK